MAGTVAAPAARLDTAGMAAALVGIEVVEGIEETAPTGFAAVAGWAAVPGWAGIAEGTVARGMAAVLDIAAAVAARIALVDIAAAQVEAAADHIGCIDRTGPVSCTVLAAATGSRRCSAQDLVAIARMAGMVGCCRCVAAAIPR